MAIPDSDLGLEADFDSTQFRNAIKATMQIGRPNDPNKRPKFQKRAAGRTYWKNGVQVTNPRTGREGEPLDPDMEVRTTGAVIIDDVDCALELVPVDVSELPVGKFRPTKCTVTVLDVDYAKIEGCKELLYNGDRYAYGFEPEVDGLFDVDVHYIVFYARDDS